MKLPFKPMIPLLLGACLVLGACSKNTDDRDQSQLQPGGDAKDTPAQSATAPAAAGSAPANAGSTASPSA